MLPVHLLNAGPSPADEVTAIIRLVSGGELFGVDADSPLSRCDASDTEATTATCTLRFVPALGVVDFGIEAVFVPGDARIEVQVSSATHDPHPSNNAVAFARTVARPKRVADVGVQVQTPGTVRAGEPATYTARITNFGPEAASDVRVGFAVYRSRDDTVVEGRITSATPSQGSCTETDCSLGTIAAGATVTVTLVATVPEPGTFRFGAYSPGDLRIYDPGRYDFDPTGHSNLDEEQVVATAAIRAQ